MTRTPTITAAEVRRQEFRVVSKRAGMKRKTREFRTRRGADRRMLLLGPEPWLAFDGRGPDDFWCCAGSPECGCGGQSVREYHAARRAELPAMEYFRLEVRDVGPWEAIR